MLAIMDKQVDVNSSLKREHQSLRQPSILESFKKSKPSPKESNRVLNNVINTAASTSKFQNEGGHSDTEDEEVTVIEESSSFKSKLEFQDNKEMEQNVSQHLFSDDGDSNMSSDDAHDITLGFELSKLNRMPDCCSPIADLKPSTTHSVLINTQLRPKVVPRPFPENKPFRNKWDNDHVRMPFAPENLYPVEDACGIKKLESRWLLIQKSLLKPMASSLDLEEAVMSYNGQYINKWDFSGLHSFFTDVLDHEETQAFFTTLLPAMVELALQLPHICTQPIPLLRKEKTYTVTMSQKQVASLLANAFFCTFPRRNAQRRQSEYSDFPDINFSRLFSSGVKNGGIPKHKAEKIKCILHYFRRITVREPTGTITFHRQCLQEFPKWEQLDTTLRNVCASSGGMIEDEGYGMLQVDFANKFVGGGVLNRGCVQEEIRFVICPELLVTRLLTEMLGKNECLIVKGVERYSDYTGYSSSFEWNGNYKDKTPRDSWSRRCTQIVAIDAIHFKSPKDQYKPHWLMRELNKAYCGFYEPHSLVKHLPAVATGNWGCGAFRGDPQLKSLLQLIAAAEAGRDVVYFTFHSASLCKEIHHMHTFLVEKKMSIGDIWKVLQKYHENIPVYKKHHVGLFNYIYKTVAAFNSDTDVEEAPTPPRRKRQPNEVCDVLELENLSAEELGMLQLYAPSTSD